MRALSRPTLTRGVCSIAQSSSYLHRRSPCIVNPAFVRFASHEHGPHRSGPWFSTYSSARLTSPAMLFGGTIFAALLATSHALSYVDDFEPQDYSAQAQAQSNVKRVAIIGNDHSGSQIYSTKLIIFQALALAVHQPRTTSASSPMKLASERTSPSSSETTI